MRLSSSIEELLGPEAKDLLEYSCKGILKEELHLPGPDFVDRVFIHTDRPANVLNNLQRIFNAGRLAGTGYVSCLPVDQGIEHSAAYSFEPNPIYFDPENIVKLAVEGGCNIVGSTLGVLGMMSRKYAHKIPFLVKLNHNELLTYPNKYDQIEFGSVDQAFDLGAAAVGATVYYGSDESARQIQEVREIFEYAHELGMVTVLWAYLRNPAFKTSEKDYHVSADLTGQANHLAATIQADIVKQKQPENDGGFRALKFSKIPKDKFYNKLVPNHPIEWTRWQVVNCYMGRIGLINSGGASLGKGEKDLAKVVKKAVINKRAGGMGLITGRKAFQKPLKEGIELLNAVQDVYLSKEITIA